MMLGSNDVTERKCHEYSLAAEKCEGHRTEVNLPDNADADKSDTRK